METIKPVIKRTSPLILVTSDEFNEKLRKTCKELGTSPTDFVEKVVNKAIDALDGMKIDMSEIRSGA